MSNPKENETTKPKESSEQTPENHVAPKPPGMFDFRKQKSFEFGFEVNKQFITISAAIITVSVTFMNYTGKSYSEKFLVTLAVSWVVLLISIIAGFASMQSITGELSIKETPDIYDSKIRMFTTVQIVTFILAIILMILFGYISFGMK